MAPPAAAAAATAVRCSAVGRRARLPAPTPTPFQPPAPSSSSQAPARAPRGESAPEPLGPSGASSEGEGRPLVAGSSRAAEEPGFTVGDALDEIGAELG